MSSTFNEKGSHIGVKLRLRMEGAGGGLCKMYSFGMGENREICAKCDLKISEKYDIIEVWRPAPVEGALSRSL